MQEWIMDQWEKNYYITSLAGANNGSSLVVMSKGLSIVAPLDFFYLYPFKTYQQCQKPKQSCGISQHDGGSTVLTTIDALLGSLGATVLFINMLKLHNEFDCKLWL